MNQHSMNQQAGLYRSRNQTQDALLGCLLACIIVPSAFFVLLTLFIALQTPSAPPTQTIQSKAKTVRQDPKQQAKDKANAREQEHLQNLKRDAWINAQEEITQRLMSPSTASFGLQSWDGVDNHVSTGYNNTRFKVDGWVDSQNGFGAIIRTIWIVKMDHKDNQWELVEIIARENGSQDVQVLYERTTMEQVGPRQR